MSAPPPAAPPLPARTPTGIIWIERILRLGLCGVLGYAGIAKLPHGWSFAEAIANYHLFPAQANQFAAVIVPWMETLCAALLLCGVWVRPAALVSSGLFGVFAAAVLSAIVRGLDIDCGCFGTGTASEVGFHTLILDGACLLASLALVWIATRRSQR